MSTGNVYTREAFAADLQVAGLNVPSFAALYGLHPGTVYQWGGGRLFPAWVEPALLDRASVLSLNASNDALRRDYASLKRLCDQAGLPTWGL